MSARDALEWMKSKAAGHGDRFLFRGQNRVWPSIKPSITRLDDQTIRDMYNVCRWFQRAAQGIGGYCIPNEHDRLAILQHYIGRSPVIDLTATPEVALYFALLGADPERECVVYSVDRSNAGSSEVVFSDHSFLALPLQHGGAKHRWLRQDGYSVGPARWRDLTIVKEFDLLRLPGVEERRFIPAPEDNELIAELGDLEDTLSDALALSVRGVVMSVARSLDLVTTGIMGALNASKSRDPNAELAAEIEDLMSRAVTAKASKDILDNLESLRAAVGRNWDTSFECALDVTRERVDQLERSTHSAESGARADRAAQ
jgi:hypothetical protein